MAVATVLSVAQTLFAALQCSELRELCSVLGYKSQLDSLADTVNTVKAVLLDAEAKRELTNEAQLYIERLKDAVYDADDLLDEFVTLAQLKHGKFKNGGKVSSKLHAIFSRFQDFAVARRMSKGVKAIKKELDDIADNHNKFGFKLDSEPIRKRREATCSYVYAQDIIGRDADREYIVGKLLDSDVKRDDVSFLTIVGMGGMGKTTLAQLIYNDERISKEFPSKLWVCVGDEDTKRVNVTPILAKIMGLMADQKYDDTQLEKLQGEVRELLQRQKYLLVLDDVWNENRFEWLKLEIFLKGGPRGSWVVVTTRSRKTASIVGERTSYELKGLSDEDSWCLFNKAALGQDEDQANSTDLVEIGKDITQKCANVPLALKVVGSLLFGQGKEKWLLFQKNSLAEITQKENDILPILKLSYDNLESPLKACFSYCALFPKDYAINKETLINLWIAHGYVDQSNDNESIADTSEEYFAILLRRCFFQDIEKDENDEIISFKIHDLMHDVAQGVTRHEICVVDFIPNKLVEKNRHISFNRWSRGGKVTNIKARTLLPLKTWSNDFPVDEVLGNCMRLRALDLRNLEISKLPDSIGQLLHLRYIDLSENSDMKVLPKSITKLHNLLTLNLRGCEGLVEFPETFSKLNKLMFLDTHGCKGLTHMPSNMGRLSCLCKLPLFVVDATNSGYVEQLESLQGLTRLKGKLEIKIVNSKKVGKYVKKEGSQRGCLINKQHLEEIEFWFEKECSNEEAVEYEEALMENMQPHPNLRKIELHYYHGAKLPGWKREQNFSKYLPNLVRIELRDCGCLRRIAHVSGLCHLRVLILARLDNLEYIEENVISEAGRGGRASATVEEKFPFFPSLEELELMGLPKLKGWWRGIESSGVGDDAYLLLFPSFPCLSKLTITYCGKLSCIPLCTPILETLILREFNEKMRIMERGGGRSWGRDRDGRTSPSPSTSTSTSSSPSLPLECENFKLREIETDNVKHLNWDLPVQAFRCLTRLTISFDSELERLEEVKEVWKNCSSSLKYLGLVGCRKLRSVSGGLEHLTSLEELDIKRCANLRLTEEKEVEGDENATTSTTPLPCPWQSLQHCLRALTLIDIPLLVNLPEGMQHLSSLQSLEIRNCKALESLPLPIPNLTRLEVWECSEALMLRCSQKLRSLQSMNLTLSPPLFPPPT